MKKGNKYDWNTYQRTVLSSMIQKCLAIIVRTLDPIDDVDVTLYVFEESCNGSPVCCKIMQINGQSRNHLFFFSENRLPSVGLTDKSTFGIASFSIALFWLSNFIAPKRIKITCQLPENQYRLMQKGQPEKAGTNANNIPNSCMSKLALSLYSTSQCQMLFTIDVFAASNGTQKCHHCFRDCTVTIKKINSNTT